MTRRSRALFIALLALGTSAAFGEGGGSIYSMLGVGDLQYLPSARSAGMGNTGIGLYSLSSIYAWAPGTWSRLDRVRMEGNLLTEGFNSTDGTRSQFLSKTTFQGVMFGLPISPADGITIVAGMTPYSRINFDVVGPYSFSGLEDTLEYTVRYKGTGGIGKAQLGASWEPLTNLSIGASFDFLFGSIERSVVVTPSSAFASGTGTSVVQIYGPSTTLGVMYSGFGSIAPALRPLSIGGYISSRSTLHTERRSEYTFTSSADTLYSTNERLTIPLSIGVGASYQLSPTVVLAADFAAQKWSAMELNGVHPEGMRDSYRLGGGVEFGGSRAFGATWWSRITWRLGASYAATNYQVKGTAINEWVGTAGCTVPVYSDVTNDTRFTVALQAGRRGTLENNLVRDTVFRMMFSLNIGQVWFIPSRED
jgi:hypothetical protein